MEQLEGKVAVVTGAASGIGLALARRFAAEGMRLVVGDIEAPALDAEVAELRASGAEVTSLVVDVSHFDQVDALGQTAVDAYGALHLAVNNAGVSGGGLSWEIPLETWRWVLDVNLWGVIHGVRAFVPRIIASGGGHVVNTASMAGLTSPPGMSPYNVSKHGVVTLSETLYQELQMMHPEVGVTVLCPGWVNTKIHEADRNRPEGVPGQPDADTGGVDMRAIITGLIEGGMDPADVAEMVVSAVRAERFYALTHDGWEAMARTRMERLLAGENPQLALPIDVT